MRPAASPTELTTSATDLVLALECLAILAWLWRRPAVDRWKIGLASWLFGLLAFASLLGFVAHGFAMAPSTRAAIWKPLNLSLGLVVALFLVLAFHDWRGRAFAGRLVPGSIGLGLLFFGLTEFSNRGFIIFVVYEAAAMSVALATYSCLAVTRQLQGAGLMAGAICLNMAAAGVQASDMSITIFVPFDHNGVFHLIQMVGLGFFALVCAGACQSMPPDQPRACQRSNRRRRDSVNSRTRKQHARFGMLSFRDPVRQRVRRSLLQCC